MLFLFTHLVVREDALTLYGFESQADSDLFNILLGVDGVGPKVALSVLSTLTLDTIQRAIFARRRGIAGQSARRGQEDRAKNGAASQGQTQANGCACQSRRACRLRQRSPRRAHALGYSVVEAQAAIQVIPKDAPKDVEERLRVALQHFQ
jgi:holliday junction DNA helicase RuvA